MVLGCLKLGTQSTITGLMAKHCYTASLLSMVSSHFTAVLASSSHVCVYRASTSEVVAEVSNSGILTQKNSFLRVTSSNYCKVVVLFVPLNTESILQIGAVQGLMEHDAYTKSRRELVVLHCQQTNKYIYRFKPDVSHPH